MKGRSCNECFCAGLFVLSCLILLEAAGAKDLTRHNTVNVSFLSPPWLYSPATQRSFPAFHTNIRLVAQSLIVR